MDGGFPENRPILVLTASMGDGHTAVACELARRLRDLGRRPVVLDVLRMLPAGIGPALRAQYELMLRFRPELYDSIYQRFGRADQAYRTVAPVTALLRRVIGDAVAAYRPRAVVSTFHLAGAAAGQLRGSGRLRVPSIVVISEFAAHELWLAPDTDLFVCPSEWVAARAYGQTGRPAFAPGPVVSPRFRPAPPCPDLRRALGLPEGSRPVLVGGGAWGAGDVRDTVADLHTAGRYTPLVLCGHNDRLRRSLTRDRSTIALGWQPDLAPLLNLADAFIDNAAGSTCCEAFAARTPVVAYRPLSGHGRAGTARLAHHRLIRSASDPAELLGQLDAITEPGPARDHQTARASALFHGDAARTITGRLDDAPGRPRPASTMDDATAERNVSALGTPWTSG